jgi:hypothetical protein
MVTFLSRQYRLVYMLDISPSAASTDIKKGCVLLEQMASIIWSGLVWSV